MGLRHTILDQSVTRYIDIVKYPVSDSLKSIFYLGTSSAACMVNWAPGGVAASRVGTSVSHLTGYSTFAGAEGGSNIIDTADYDDASAAVTKIALFSNSGTKTAYGIYSGNNVFVVTAADARAYGGGALKTLGYAGTPPTYASPPFYFKALGYDPTEQILRSYRGIDGVIYVSEIALTAPRATAHTIETIGGTGNAAFTGTLNIAAIAKHHKHLSVDQLTLIYAYWRFKFTKLGLVVA